MFQEHERRSPRKPDKIMLRLLVSDPLDRAFGVSRSIVFHARSMFETFIPFVRSGTHSGIMLII